MARDIGIVKDAGLNIDLLLPVPPERSSFSFRRRGTADQLIHSADTELCSYIPAAPAAIKSHEVDHILRLSG